MPEERREHSELLIRIDEKTGSIQKFIEEHKDEHKEHCREHVRIWNDIEANKIGVAKWSAIISTIMVLIWAIISSIFRGVFK